jgi:cell pole-organizing protein PopZ
LRDLKVSVLPASPSATAATARTEDLLALRSRIADLSATRERLARISAGGPSSFASVLGGYARPDETQARSGRKNGFEAQLPPPPGPLRGGIADPTGAVAWDAQPATTRLDAPAAERATVLPPQPDAFDEADEGYIESSLPDPGAADYAAEAWDADEDAAEDGSGTASLPAVSGVEIATSRAMLSQEVADATATAFDRLADTIVSQASGGARSIEDITRDLLRPMLKAWLDTNLQGVVERLVREEIDRVARRSGR